MIWTNLLYGWLVMTNLVTTGEVWYASPRAHGDLRAVDEIEILLGSSERCLATATNATGHQAEPMRYVESIRGTNGMMTVTNSLTWQLASRGMLTSNDAAIKAAVPFYVQTNSLPSPSTNWFTPWTYTGLVDSLGIGFSNWPYQVEYTNYEDRYKLLNTLEQTWREGVSTNMQYWRGTGQYETNSASPATNGYTLAYDAAVSDYALVTSGVFSATLLQDCTKSFWLETNNVGSNIYQTNNVGSNIYQTNLTVTTVSNYISITTNLIVVSEGNYSKEIAAWGAEGADDGQVSDTPTNSGWTAIAAGGYHSLALSSSGTITSWGDDTYGQVSDTPTNSGWTAIAAGHFHSLALSSSGTITSWGDDTYGQVSDTPTNSGWTAIAGGFYHSLALDSDGTIFGWGLNTSGQVSDTPTNSGWTAIAAGHFHSLALSSSGTIASWGYGGNGQVSDTPTNSGWTAIAGGFYHSLALASDGTIFSWGDDTYGQVSDTPINAGYSKVAGGGYHSLAITDNRTAPEPGGYYNFLSSNTWQRSDGNFYVFPGGLGWAIYSSTNLNVSNSYLTKSGTVTGQYSAVGFWTTNSQVSYDLVYSNNPVDPSGTFLPTGDFQSRPAWNNAAWNIVYSNSYYYITTNTDALSPAWKLETESAGDSPIGLTYSNIVGTGITGTATVVYKYLYEPAYEPAYETNIIYACELRKYGADYWAHTTTSVNHRLQGFYVFGADPSGAASNIFTDYGLGITNGAWLSTSNTVTYIGTNERSVYFGGDLSTAPTECPDASESFPSVREGFTLDVAPRFLFDWDFQYATNRYW